MQTHIMPRWYGSTRTSLFISSSKTHCSKPSCLPLVSVLASFPAASLGTSSALHHGALDSRCSRYSQRQHNCTSLDCRMLAQEVQSNRRRARKEIQQRPIELLRTKMRGKQADTFDGKQPAKSPVRMRHVVVWLPKRQPLFCVVCERSRVQYE